MFMFKGKYLSFIVCAAPHHTKSTYDKQRKKKLATKKKIYNAESIIYSI